MKILFVDDTEDNINLFQLYMKSSEGIECVFETDPEKSVDLINNENFDIIFLDIEMPVLDGFQVIEKIKADKSSIYALTAHVSGEVFERIKRHDRIKGIITKPVLKKKIIEVISSEEV